MADHSPLPTNTPAAATQSSNVGTPFRGSPARIPAPERRYVRPVKPETNFRTRGMVQLGLMLLSFLCLFVSIFLNIGGIQAASWYGEITFTGSMSLWSACLQFDQCNSATQTCVDEQQCLDPAWLTCSASADLIYASRIIIILAVISYIPGLILAALDALGKSSPKMLCMSDRAIFVALGVLRGVLIATSGGLATATWTGSICGQRLLDITGTTIGAMPYTALVAFVLNLVAAIVGGCAPQPKDQKEEIAARRKAKKARQAQKAKQDGGEEDYEMDQMQQQQQQQQPPQQQQGGQQPGSAAPAPSEQPSSAAAAMAPRSGTVQQQGSRGADEEDAEVAATLGSSARPMSGTQAVMPNR